MISPLEHLQFQYEFSMAIGQSLDLKTMLRKSISTILRKLNCQAGGVLTLKKISSKYMCLEQVFSIPRDTQRIEAYQQAIDSLPNKITVEWLESFTQVLPRHLDISPNKHLYLLNLPGYGILILLKNSPALDPILIKSFTPLLSKLATSCIACEQNEELIRHRNDLETLVQEKSSELVERNYRLEQEILQKVQTEKELRESEERYAAVVNQAVEGIFLLDPTSKEILHSNQSLQKMVGYTKEALIGRQVYDIVYHHRSEVDNNIEIVPTLDHYFVGERKYRHHNGTAVDVEVSAKTITFSGKRSILVIVRDISDKKRAQEEKEELKEKLRHAQKFEALGSLAGGVAHDLNNILSGIIGYPELLLKKIPQGSELTKPLMAIHDSGMRASTIVADLLTVARSAASVREKCNLHELIDQYCSSPEFLELTSEHSEVVYEKELKARKPFILCSSVHIKKCLMNLVVNATEAIGDEGTVRIKTYEQEKSDNSYVVVEISDTGPGISRKDQQRIFDPFYTKKEMGRSGTGLGLTVVHNTVIDHSGKITVDSSEHGTSFKLYFPYYSEEDKEELHEKQVESYMSKNKEQILVVDDEPLLQDIASGMLSELGYQVTVVSSGEEAVEYTKKHHVDLFIIDMLMDPGINGRQTFEALREIMPDAKAIIVSGFSESNEVKRVLQLGAKAFVLKPYSFGELGEIVQEVLLS